MKHRGKSILAAAFAIVLSAPAGAQALRIGMQDDVDTIDPVRTRSLAALNVLASLCDTLVELKPDLSFGPRLATAWTWSADGKALTLTLRPGVKFHDGDVLDAEAVKFNLDQTRTLPESLRKTGLASVTNVAVVDPGTVRLDLSAPDAALISQLAFTPGMIVSPRAARELGGRFGAKPVCSGPYRFVERVPQDRVVLERFPDHWDKGRYGIERMVFLPIADSAVRYANLRSGDLDIIERVTPTDAKAIRQEGTLTVATAESYGYQALYINVGNGERAKTPLGQDKRVRQALDLVTARRIINEVAFEGFAPATNQPFGQASPWFDKDIPVTRRNRSKARALLREAGVKTPFTIEMELANTPSSLQVASMLQAMWGEVGIELKLNVKETATLLKEAASGQFQISFRGTGGYADPDPMLATFVSCKSPLNDGRYCNPALDDLIVQGRSTLDPAERKPIYDKAIAALIDDMPVIYLYQPQWVYAHTRRLAGFQALPSGQIHLEDVRLQP